jgi:elongator complex protein 3
MGVQSTDNAILDLNQRGHHIEEVRKALHKLRQYAFKFSIHIMPGLYGSTVEKDIQTFSDVYSDPFLKPDEIKFYPTSVIP